MMPNCGENSRTAKLRPPIDWRRPVSILVTADCIQIFTRPQQIRSLGAEAIQSVPSTPAGSPISREWGFTVGDAVEAANNRCLFPSGKTVPRGR